MISEISEFFLKRPINVTKDSRLQKKIVLRGFLGATIYSIIYGIYEYFEVYHGINIYGRLNSWLGPVLGSVANWTIMWSGLIITVAIVTRFSIQNIIMGLFYMSVLEDFVFWLCQWGSTSIYPFPAGDWWDGMFATYRVLGNWGQAIPFWPYIPFYYLPSIAMLCIYYLSAYKGALYGRITAWLIGPIFLVIVGAAFLDDFTATLCLIFGPFAFLAYGFALALYSSYKSEKKPENT